MRDSCESGSPIRPSLGRRHLNIERGLQGASIGLRWQLRHQGPGKGGEDWM